MEALLYNLSTLIGQIVINAFDIDYRLQGSMGSFLNVEEAGLSQSVIQGMQGMG